MRLPEVNPSSPCFISFLRKTFRNVLSPVKRTDDLAKIYGEELFIGGSRVAVPVKSAKELRKRLRFDPPETIELKKTTPEQFTKKINDGLDHYFRTPDGRFLRWTRTSKHEEIIELRDYVGNIYYFRRGDALSGGISLNVFRNSLMIMKEFDDFSQLGFAKIRTFDPSAFSLEQLSLRLSQSQLQVSQSLAGKIDSSLVAANAYMIRALSRKKTLQVSDLESINLLASFHSESDEVRFRLGVIRGEKRILVHGDRKITIDNRSMKETHGVIVQYSQPHEVPLELKKWLNDLQGIKPGTSLSQITALTQRFIEIHPFVDGNGRTTNILLDYMLLKAGYPPMPHDPFLTKNLMFMRTDDLEKFFRAAYRNAGLLE